MLYIIPNINDIETSISLAKRYNAAFEYNDFYRPEILTNEERFHRAIHFYKSLDRDRSKDTLHGAFMDVTVHSSDPGIVYISDLRIRQSMKAAAELGVRAVIFHTNILPNFSDDNYLEQWCNKNETYFRKLCDRYPKIDILMENMFDDSPDNLVRLAYRMKDVRNFGICFDYAHALIFGHNISIAEWTSKLLPYTRHMHINDHNGKSDLHLAVGNGVTDWNEYERMIEYAEVRPSVLIETTVPENIELSVKYMKNNRIYPFTETDQKFRLL